MSDKYPGGFVTTGAPAGFSVAFDGTGDYVSAAGNAAFSFTGDFTVECWIYHTAQATQYYGICSIGAYTNGVMLRVESSGGVWYFNPFVNGTTATFPTAALKINLNTWYHVAVVRSGTTVTNYLNGVPATTMTVSGTVNSTNGAVNVGLNDLSQYWNGYISNFRILKGTALYTAAFTPPTQLFPITNTSLLTCQSPTIVDNSSNAFTITANGDAKVSNFTPFAGYTGFNPALGAAAGGVWTLDEAAYYQNNRQWPIYDPYFKQTTLMLHGNSPTNLPTWIKDASTNNFALTVVSTAKAEAQSPFSKTTYPTSGSGYFNGSSDYLTWTGTIFGTSDYTLEFWAYKTSSWTDGFDFLDAATSGLALYVSAGTMAVTKQNTGGAAVVLGSLTSLAINTWYHFAVIRSGGSVRCYVNGSALQASVAEGNNYTVATTRICGTGDGYYDGYISNIRLATSALYSIAGSTITVPTEPLTAVSSTQLLTLQNSQPTANSSFVDSSTNNFPITRFANTTQGTFTPFSQTGWSNYFLATSSLQIPSGSSISGTGNFTIEFWIWPTTFASGYQVVYANVTNSGFSATVNSTGTIGYGRANVATDGTTTGTVTFNAWNHVAFVRTGTGANQFVIYINGVAAGTFTNATSYVAGIVRLGTDGNGSSFPFTGYLSNLRNNTNAVYTSNFTPPTQPLTAIAGTTLLTCQDNRFVDDSAGNYAITVNSTVSVQAFSPFVPTVTTPTTYSNWFNGSTGYLTVPSNAAFDFWAGSFTFECWFYPIGNLSNSVLFSTGSSTTGVQLGFSSNTQLYTNQSGGSTLISGVAPTLNTWNYIVLTKSGSTFALFLNGVRLGTSTSTAYPTGNQSAFIGANSANNLQFISGLISNARLVKGTAVYDPTLTTMTVPTAPLTNISGTSLLTCQSSTLIDNSTANGGVGFTITQNGVVQPATSPTPFPAKVDTTTLNTAYSTSLIGGSGYFDGTGDYLTATYPINWSTYGSYTLEFWFYAPTIAANNFGFVSTGSTGYTNFYMYGSSGSYPGAIAIGIQGTNELRSANSVIAANTWYHIAYTYDGTTTRIFVNGVSVASGTTAVYSNNSANLVIGNGLSNNYTLGYISGLRLIQGTALYTQNFAPPVLPPTSTGSQTKLLLNYTNAGIIDNTAKNVLETVGNAQISTTQSKWGGSSMFFDGTGDRLVNLVSSPSYGLANSDYTVECWVYPNSFSTTPYIISAANGTTSTNWALYITTGGALGWGGNTGVNQFSAGTISTSTWTHIAISQSGTNVYWFINGVLVLTKTKTDINNASWVSTSTISIGSSYGTNEYNGYIDDLRITKGVARYTANFTPPTSQLQDQ